MSCGTCRFRDTDGRCHREPPHFSNRDNSASHWGIWPRVRDHDWCAEYKELTPEEQYLENERILRDTKNSL